MRIARIDADREFRRQAIELLKHPVYSTLIAFIAIEALQKHGYMGNLVGTALETALVAGPVLQEMAKSGVINSFIEAGGKGLESITKLAPLLALG